MIIKKNSKNQSENNPSGSSDKENSSGENTPSINLFDLDNIDFTARDERRRGERRRGFRRTEDRNLISRAREEANVIKATAQKEGYENGINDANDAIDNFKNQLAKFYNAKQEVFEAIMPEIMNISVDIAKKIIKTEVQENPDLILSNIQQCLKTLSKEETKLMIKLNPIDAPLVKTQIPTMIEQAGLEVKVMIMPDNSITQGGAIIQTTNGITDVTIDTQIDIVTKALREV
ncbi:hypothetical protein J6S88_02030 [bacterium]|nr:hypothetical protein [bacterium]